jgi:hypothetical protein
MEFTREMLKDQQHLCKILRITHLTKSGQNVDLWTFCDYKGIGKSQQAAKFLKIERTICFF